MGLLQNFLDRWKLKKAKEKEISEDYDINKRVLEKHKNANERELERYMEEDRQAMIQKRLELYRKRKTNEMWQGAPVLKGNKKLYSDNTLMKGRKFNTMGSCFLR